MLQLNENDFSSLDFTSMVEFVTDPIADGEAVMKRERSDSVSSKTSISNGLLDVLDMTNLDDDDFQDVIGQGTWMDNVFDMTLISTDDTSAVKADIGGLDWMRETEVFDNTPSIGDMPSIDAVANELNVITTDKPCTNLNFGPQPPKSTLRRSSRTSIATKTMMESATILRTRRSSRKSKRKASTLKNKNSKNNNSNKKQRTQSSKMKASRCKAGQGNSSSLNENVANHLVDNKQIAMKSNAANTATDTSDSSTPNPLLTGGRPMLHLLDSNITERIGAYTLVERKKRILRFLEKRKHRVWTKRINYGCRKRLADDRPRVRGRFVKCV